MDVKRLLKKKGWTGEEAGKALILDLINSYKQNLAGNMNPKPLFPMERIAEMLHALRDSKTDIEAYNRYVHLQNWILQYQAVANANLQRYNSSFNEFVRIHNAAEAAENEYRYIEQLPRIVTQKQYEELKAKSLEADLEKIDGECVANDDIFQLIIRLTTFYALELEDNPKKANPLKAVKKLYQKKPLENKAYILHYNKEMTIGYLQLPDGTRSDKVTVEEFLTRLIHYNPDLQRLLTEAKEGYAGQPGSLLYERLTKTARAAHMGEQGETEDFFNPATTHIYEEAQEGLTKWEFIRAGAEGDIFFSDCIPALIGDAHGKSFVADAEAFKKEFPELLEAILKALDGMGYTNGDKPLSAIPLKEWEKTEFSWEELYNTDFPGFREELESDSNIFAIDERALINGVAILRPVLKKKGKAISAAIDENGYFIEPEAKTMFSNMFGLDAYTPDNPESGDNINRIERNRETLMESVRFVVSYDLSLELIAEAIGIPEFTLFKADGAHCLERVEALNSLFDLLYTHIAEISYNDEKRKAAKLQALRDVFYPIDLAALKVSEGRKQEAAKMLEGLEAFGEGRTGTSPGWNFLALLSAPEGRAEE